MKKLRRILSALIITGCVATTAQAGIFSFFGDIIQFFTTVITDLTKIPALAEHTISFAITSLDNLVNDATSLFGGKMSSNLQSKPAYASASANGTNSQGQNLNSAYAGNSNTFTNQLNSYKSNTCSNPPCSTVNSNTLYNTNSLDNQSQQQQAKAYAQNASGAGIGIATPNHTAATPATVKYAAYYNTQTAIQSNANNNMAAALSDRTPTSVQGQPATSPLSFRKSSFENFNSSSEYQNGLFSKDGLGGLLIGPFISAAQTLMTLPHTIGSAVDGISRINAGVSTLQSTGSQGMSYTVGNQLKANADQEDTGTPFKKSPED